MIETYGLPYNYESIMHLNQYAFGRAKTDVTIVAKDQTFQVIYQI